MKPSVFRGIIPPMMTAFTTNGEIYEQGTREMVDIIVPHVQGLYPVGSYGSGPMMSIAERKRTADMIIDQVKGRVPVIVHVGCADTKNTVDLAKHAESIGAAAVGAVTPYYMNTIRSASTCTSSHCWMALISRYSSTITRSCPVLRRTSIPSSDL